LKVSKSITTERIEESIAVERKTSSSEENGDVNEFEETEK